MRSFCDTRHSPATDCRAGVHNPCPQSASHNHRSPRVVRRSSVIYSATPVSTPDQPPMVIWFRLLPAIRSLPRIVLAMTRGHSERMTRAANGTTLAGRSLVPPRRHRPRCSLRCHRRDKRPRRRLARVVANHDGPGRLQLGLARRGLGRVGRVRNLTLEPGTAAAHPCIIACSGGHSRGHSTRANCSQPDRTQRNAFPT